MTSGIGNGDDFVIKEGMSVYEVGNKGNAKQKAAAKIFDYNGDGIYDSFEAKQFNESVITVKGNKVTIVENLGYDNEPEWTGYTQTKEDINKDYEKRSSQYKSNAALLRRFGFNEKEVLDNWVNGDDVKCSIVTNKSGEQIFKIEDRYMDILIPIDNNFEPSKLRIKSDLIENNDGKYESLIELENINCTVKLKDEIYDGTTERISIKGNSKVYVKGVDGLKDKVFVSDGAKVSFSTGDYADVIVDNTTEKERHLKPGITTVKSGQEVVGYRKPAN